MIKSYTLLPKSLGIATIPSHLVHIITPAIFRILSCPIVDHKAYTTGFSLANSASLKHTLSIPPCWCCAFNWVRVGDFSRLHAHALTHLLQQEFVKFVLHR